MQQLENPIVRLEPLNLTHIDELFHAAQAASIWTHMSVTLDSKEQVTHYVQDALEKMEAGTDFPFVIIDQQTNQVVGSTWFMDISHVHKRLEIGSTWLTPAVWRSAINTNCKYLLLQYGFEQLKFNRIQIKTDHMNVQSQKAIERLGATKEGTLKNHMIRKDGTQRHTVMYSITLNDWPIIQQHFLNNLLKLRA